MVLESSELLTAESTTKPNWENNKLVVHLPSSQVAASREGSISVIEEPLVSTQPSVTEFMFGPYRMVVSVNKDTRDYLRISGIFIYFLRLTVRS